MRPGTRNFLNGIHKNVIILGFVSLLTDLSGQLVFPLLPLYLTTVLGASAVAVGVVEGAAEAAASLLKVVSGYWSDKISKRKPFVFLGYGLSAAMKPLLALVGSWPLILVVRVFDRVGKGLRDAPRDALIAESSGNNSVGKSFGFQRSMDGLGSVGGAMLAFLLLPILGYSKLFLLAIIPGLLSVVIINFVKEKEHSTGTNGVNKQLRFSLKELTPDLKIFVLIAFIFTLGNYSYAFLMLRAKNIGFSDVATIQLYALFYLVYTLLSTYSGALSDRLGRKPVILAGYFLFALVSLGLFLFSGKASLILFFALFGIFFALTDGTQRAFVADLSPEHLKGTALGTYHTLTGLAALPAGLIAGLLWEKTGPEGTFLFGCAVSALATFIFLASDKMLKYK